MALGLKNKNDASYFLKGSEGRTKLFNIEQGLVFPKNENGKWTHKDPLNGKGWVKANAWQATWSVSHDIKILSTLMGGNDVLYEKLNFAFEQVEPQILPLLTGMDM